MFEWLWKSKQPEKAQPELPDDLDQILRFGSLLMHESETTQHLLAVGTTGSGKTTLMRLFLQGLLWRIRPGSDKRLLLYDAKQDAYSMLKGIHPDVLVHILNPFDSRCVAWDMARDIKEPRMALQVAVIIILSLNENQPFFVDASRDVVAHVIISFMRRGLDWTLADVLRALRDVETLRRVLLACPETAFLVDRYFGDPRLLSSILSTLGTKLKAFEVLAFAWEKAERRISLAEWVESESVLLLGNSEISREAINAINRCIFRCMCNLALDQSESQSRRTYVMLDEVSEAGKLDGLASLCKKGRSKGVSVFLAFQSIAGLRDPNLYGQHQSAEILGQIGHRWLGRIECPETAKWASDVVGEQEIRRETVSRTYAKENSTTHQEQIVTQKTVLPSQFMSIPPCNVSNGLSGYYVSRITGAYYDTLEGQDLFYRDLIPNAANVPDFVPRSVEDQYFRPWTDEQKLLFAPLPEGEAEQSDHSARNRPNIDLSALDDLDNFDDLEDLEE